MDRSWPCRDRSPANITFQPGQHLPGSCGKRATEDLAVLADGTLDFVAGENEQPAGRPPGLPTQPTDAIGSRSFIPTELAFDRAKVIEPRLDFDDQQGPVRRMEREQIDPTMRSTLYHFDLARSQPSGRTQAPIDMTRASCVDQISLSRPTDDGRSANQELHLESERSADPLDDIE